MKEIVFMEKEDVEKMTRKIEALDEIVGTLWAKVKALQENNPTQLGKRVADLEQAEKLQRTVNDSIVENFKRHDKVLGGIDDILHRLEKHNEAFGRLGQRMAALEGSNLDDKVRESLKRIMRV
jgi:hypothetical protein